MDFAEDLRAVDVEQFEAVKYQLPATITMLGVIVLVGGLGNGLVLLVYAQKNDRQTATLFILVLAIVDFITCFIIVPFTMLNECLYWQIGSTALCKFYYLLNISNTQFSTLLISAIAIDRYLCICHPFLRAMTVPRAKVFIGILACVSLTMGLCGMNFAFLALEPIMDEFGSMNQTVQVCVDPSALNMTTSDNTELFLFNIILKITHACFGVCILLVVILYVLIYRSILLIRKKKRMLKGIRMKTITTLVNVTTGDQGIVPIVTKAEETNCRGGLGEGDTCLEPLGNGRRKSVRYLRDTQTFQNMKTAMMLFVVALVFILTFFPAILMGNKLISLNLVVFYMYYLNNASNPIIYCFMNRNFREDVRKLFQKDKPANSKTI